LASEDRLHARFAVLMNNLASAEPAPASGAAAAAVVAASAALLQKVALRSSQWEGAADAHKRAEGLRFRAEDLVEQDTHAFLAYLEAAGNRTDVAAARSRTIDTPLAIAELAFEVIELAHEMERHGNPNLKADAIAAAIIAHSSVTVGAMLVQVNLRPGERDKRRAEVLDLVRAASESVRRQAARVRGGGPRRAPEQSRDSGGRSPLRNARETPSTPPRPAASTARKKAARRAR